MPGIMFQDVVSSRARSHRSWYTLPLSFLVHTAVIAILVVVPLVATDVLPLPREVLQYTMPSVMPVVEPPPVMRPATIPAPVAATPGAPVVAPETIGAETAVIVDPGAVDTKSIDGIVGLGVAPVGVEALPAPPPAAPVEPVRLSSGIKPPVRTRYVPPVYPEMARRNRIQGIVIIEAIIGIDGKVENVSILKSQPMLDQAALSAVTEWEYTPTRLNGVAVPVIMTVTVRFTLDSQ